MFHETYIFVFFQRASDVNNNHACSCANPWFLYLFIIFYYILLFILSYFIYFILFYFIYSFIFIHFYLFTFFFLGGGGYRGRQNVLTVHGILLNRRLRHSCSWVIPASSGLLSYTITPYVLAAYISREIYFHFVQWLGSSGSAITHPPGCFYPWTFSLHVGLNMLPLDSIMLCLDSLLGYSNGEFQALQIIVLAVFGPTRTALNHYLNQCSLFISYVKWNLS